MNHPPASPFNAKQALKNAFAAHQAGDLAQAEHAYLHIITQKPQFAQAYHLIGTLYLQTQQFHKARDFLQKASEIAPNQAPFELNLGIAYKQLNDIQTAITHFRNAISLDPAFVPAYFNLGNTYLQLDQHAQACQIYQQALTFAPENAALHNHLGQCYCALKNHAQAQIHLLRALDLQPHYAGAHNNLGLNYNAQNQPQQAIAHFLKAIAQQPMLIEAHFNLAHTLNALEQFETAITHWQIVLKHTPRHPLALFELGNAYYALNAHHTAIALYEQAIGLAPKFALAWMNLGVALQALLRFEQAEKAYHQACQCDENLAQAQFYRATLWLTQRQFKSGWAAYEWRQQLLQAPLSYRRWQGNRVEQLMIFAEQGYGDTLQFIRFIPLIRDRAQQLTVAVQPALMRLFKPLEKIWHLVITQYQPALLQTAQAALPLMSLPYLLEHDASYFPSPPALDLTTITAPASLTLTAHQRIKIGLCWQGNNWHKQDRRAIDLSELHTLFHLKHIDWYILNPLSQANLQDITRLNFPHLHHLTDHFHDFADTAYLISQLDAVVSIDTAIAHLAGTLHKKQWLLLPYAADWRWFEGETTPWYPQTHLIRQTQPTSWKEPIAQLHQTLSNLIKISSDEH